MSYRIPDTGDATFIVFRKGSIPANQSTKKKNLEVGRDSHCCISSRVRVKLTRCSRSKKLAQSFETRCREYGRSDVRPIRRLHYHQLKTDR